ncbi:MAG: hypothetical protein ABFD82_18995 [Syntrophaceae bacterium]
MLKDMATIRANTLNAAFGRRVRRKALVMSVFLLCVCLAACASSPVGSETEKPQEPPTLGPGGWPVGVWEAGESKNLLELYADGTGKYVFKNKEVVQGENTHVVWSYTPPKLQIIVQITTLGEGELNLPLKVNAQNRKKWARHRVSSKEKAYLHFTVFSPGESVLKGSVQWIYQWWQFNKYGDWVLDRSEVRRTPIDFRLIKKTHVENPPLPLETPKETSPSVVFKPPDDKRPSFLRESSLKSPPKEQTVANPEENIKLSLGRVYISDRHTQHTSGNANSILEAGETVMLHVRLISGGNLDPGFIKIKISSESQGVRTEGAPKVNKAKAKKSDLYVFDIQQTLKATEGFRDRQAVLRIKAFGGNNAVVIDERITVSANPSLPLF